METVVCDLCGADDAEEVFLLRDYLHNIEGIFRLVRCRQCGLMYLNPRPTIEEMPRYYPDDYHAYRVIDGTLSFITRLDYRYGIIKRCRAVIAYSGLKSGRILDVGCATGSFLDAMRRYGWECYGVEINSRAANYAREHLGLNVFAGTLIDAHYPDSFFDVVTLWNVLEHLHHPQATLYEISRIIRKNGLLVISLPNPDCVEAKIFGRYWAGLDAPRHLYIYSKHTLQKALALAGFTVKKIVSFSGRYQVLALSIGFWIDEKVSFEKLRRLLKRVVNSIPLRLLTLPYYIIVDRLNHSSVMTVFAQRRED